MDGHSKSVVLYEQSQPEDASLRRAERRAERPSADTPSPCARPIYAFNPHHSRPTSIYLARKPRCGHGRTAGAELGGEEGGSHDQRGTDEQLHGGHDLERSKQRRPSPAPTDRRSDEIHVRVRYQHGLSLKAHGTMGFLNEKAHDGTRYVHFCSLRSSGPWSIVLYNEYLNYYY